VIGPLGHGVSGFIMLSYNSVVLYPVRLGWAREIGRATGFSTWLEGDVLASRVKGRDHMT
jgi:hypothetical protein